MFAAERVDPLRTMSPSSAPATSACRCACTSPRRGMRVTGRRRRRARRARDQRADRRRSTRRRTSSASSRIPTSSATCARRPTPCEADAVRHCRADAGRPRRQAPDLRRGRRGQRVDRALPAARQPGRRRVDDSAAHHAQLVRPILEQGGLRVGTDLLLAHCPERILPGNIMAEAVYNARVVGGVDARRRERAAELFGHVRQRQAPAHRRPHRRVRQADRELLPRRQHRVRQPGHDAVRRTGHRRAAGDRARQPPSRAWTSSTPVSASAATASQSIPGFCPFVSRDRPACCAPRASVNDCMPSADRRAILESVDGADEPARRVPGGHLQAQRQGLPREPGARGLQASAGRTFDVDAVRSAVPEYACDSVLSAARGADALAILVPHDLIVTELQYRRHAILARHADAQPAGVRPRFVPMPSVPNAGAGTAADIGASMWRWLVLHERSTTAFAYALVLVDV